MLRIYICVWLHVYSRSYLPLHLPANVVTHISAYATSATWTYRLIYVAQSVNTHFNISVCEFVRLSVYVCVRGFQAGRDDSVTFWHSAWAHDLNWAPRDHKDLRGGIRDPSILPSLQRLKKVNERDGKTPYIYPIDYLRRPSKCRDF